MNTESLSSAPVEQEITGLTENNGSQGGVVVPAPGEFWEHGKSGRVYEVVGYATLKDGPFDGAMGILYRLVGDSGNIGMLGATYARPVERFLSSFAKATGPKVTP